MFNSEAVNSQRLQAHLPPPGAPAAAATAAPKGSAAAAAPKGAAAAAAPKDAEGLDLGEWVNIQTGSANPAGKKLLELVPANSGNGALEVKKLLNANFTNVGPGLWRRKSDIAADPNYREIRLGLWAWRSKKSPAV